MRDRALERGERTRKGPHRRTEARAEGRRAFRARAGRGEVGRVRGRLLARREPIRVPGGLRFAV